ncbi:MULTISPECIES: cellulase family glycosylhydrolase [Halorussus]|uniref:cellulase family glycosylhydrolase n=1 Tax=Halorussus TaxID=1070314 RepID=UPI000E21A1DB|nr:MULTISPECIES: cellulase family glycosylhydrolase [Halorussus]NHN58738.1 hypothetical protein [Halorussus sp. JP-T4]
MDEDLRGVSGAVYLPQKDWNAYQMWADYRNDVVERDLGYASGIGLNSLRVLASYEYWREDGPSFFAHVEHFLTACEARDIRPLVVLFEAPPEDPPSEENLRATDPKRAFGVHSPSRPEILQPRNWKGYDRSPIHFARRWAQEYAGDGRLLATEIMNEPGDVQPRRDFVTDALRTVRTAAPDAPLTMGTRDVRYARYYDCEALDDLPGLDAYQFHMNLPKRPAEAYEYVTEQRALADEIAAEARAERSDSSESHVPLWCTEWQRTLEEPPSRFAPNLASLAPTVRKAHAEGKIDGDYFWSLMLRPAYLRRPREKGRVNGLFHADGAVYSRADAEVLAGRPLAVPDRHALPASWNAHRFPYPGPMADGPIRSADATQSDGGAPDGSLRSGLRPDDAETADAPAPVADGPTLIRDLHETMVDRLKDALGLDSRSK